MVDRVVRRADDHALGHELAVDRHAAGEHLARRDAANRGRHAHGLVDAGAEEGARGQLGARDDLFDVAERSAHFLAGFQERLLASDEVEQGGGHGGRGRVRSGDDPKDSPSQVSMVGPTSEYGGGRRGGEGVY